MPEANSGGSSSLQILLHALEPHLRTISRKYRLDVPDSEDVLQSTLVRFTPLRPGIQNPAAWLLVAFRRECLRLLRKRTRSPELVVDLEELAAPDRAAPPLSPEERIHLSVAIEKLKPRQRRVLWQRFALGLSLKEVAEAMGCKVVTAKKAIARAIAALRRIYDGRPAG